MVTIGFLWWWLSFKILHLIFYAWFLQSIRTPVSSVERKSNFGIGKNPENIFCEIIFRKEL